ncbi:LysR family transcriptional regulator [Streptomyces mutabilis]|uniref:LysR family transcriptional regulator n=1 Tax=Streptomyces mutabilis TaxID=67332 RepID=A0A086MSL4_9ACTN|nr:LysR family transcriptional regulator [Streptomyces mutabilis]KFG71882.1 LysR family transcriptional regulator [Streptomyces mutabilis]
MHNHSKVNLDDLRYFLALARHGRLVAAGERLGVEHTTVSRRLAALERAVGHRLFERTRTGWALTHAGRRLMPHAERIEAEALLAFSGTEGEARPVSGVVRLIATDAAGSVMVAPALAPLHAQHPGIELELVTTSALISQHTGQFDVAITLHRPQLPRLHVRRLCDYALRLYAAPSYLARAEPIRVTADLADHEMVWYIESLLDLPELRVFNEVSETATFSFRSSNVFAQLEAVAAGLGVGLLPCFLADGDPRVEPVLHHELQVERTFWMIVPSALVNVETVQIVCDHVTQWFQYRADVLKPPLGQAGEASP